MKIVKIRRRNFLKNSSLLASGLILGSEIPVSANERGSRNQLGSFLQMTNGGKIRIGMPVVEMGQGIYTSLAMCALEELEMDIDQVEHIETILHPNFKNPILSKFTDGISPEFNAIAKIRAVEVFPTPLGPVKI